LGAYFKVPKYSWQRIRQLQLREYRELGFSTEALVKVVPDPKQVLLPPELSPPIGLLVKVDGIVGIALTQSLWLSILELRTIRTLKCEGTPNHRRSVHPSRPIIAALYGIP
jgi:hypothetical protein